MNLFERYLTVWVGLSILVGLGLGEMFPAVFGAVAALEVAKVCPSSKHLALIWL